MAFIVAFLLALCSFNVATVTADLQCFQARDQSVICPTDKPFEGDSLLTSDTKSVVNTPKDCYKACMGDFTCRTWQYSDSGTCTFYTASIENVFYSTGTETGNYFGSWNCEPVALRESNNCDYSNPNYGIAIRSGYRTISPTGDCQTACAADVTCLSWGMQTTGRETQCTLYHEEFSVMFQLYPTDNVFGSWDCPTKPRRPNDCSNLPKASGSDSANLFEYSSTQVTMDACFNGCFGSTICNSWSYGDGICRYYQYQIEEVFQSTLGSRPMALSTWNCPPDRREVECDDANPNLGTVGDVEPYLTLQQIDVAFCQSLCEDDVDCQTWGYERGDLLCFLYTSKFSEIFQPVQLSSVLFGAWNCAPHRPPSDCVDNQNPIIAWTDTNTAYETTAASTPQQCFMDCMNDPFCYTWSFRVNQCDLLHVPTSDLLKNPFEPSALIGSWECAPSRTPQPCDGSPLVTGAPQGPVSPYATHPNSNVDSCFQFCFQDESCQSWGVDPGNSCLLFFQDIGTLSLASGTDYHFSSYNCQPSV